MNTGSSVLTFGKVLSTISRTLGVANQVIPLYQQTKPLFANARSAYNIIKGINKPVLPSKEKKVLSTPVKQEKTIVNNSPQFFI